MIPGYELRSGSSGTKDVIPNITTANITDSAVAEESLDEVDLSGSNFGLSGGFHDAHDPKYERYNRCIDRTPESHISQSVKKCIAKNESGIEYRRRPTAGNKKAQNCIYSFLLNITPAELFAEFFDFQVR